MPKATHKLTATHKGGKVINPFRNSSTDTISVYGEDDLNRRLAAAKEHPEYEVKVEKL